MGTIAFVQTCKQTALSSSAMVLPCVSMAKNDKDAHDTLWSHTIELPAHASSSSHCDAMMRHMRIQAVQRILSHAECPWCEEEWNQQHAKWPTALMTVLPRSPITCCPGPEKASIAQNTIDPAGKKCLEHSNSCFFASAMSVTIVSAATSHPKYVNWREAWQHSNVQHCQENMTALVMRTAVRIHTLHTWQAKCHCVSAHDLQAGNAAPTRVQCGWWYLRAFSLSLDDEASEFCLGLGLGSASLFSACKNALQNKWLPANSLITQLITRLQASLLNQGLRLLTHLPWRVHD